MGSLTDGCAGGVRVTTERGVKGGGRKETGTAGWGKGKENSTGRGVRNGGPMGVGAGDKNKVVRVEDLHSHCPRQDRASASAASTSRLATPKLPYMNNNSQKNRNLEMGTGGRSRADSGTEEWSTPPPIPQKVQGIQG